jgi:hypothetical protein
MSVVGEGDVSLCSLNTIPRHLEIPMLWPEPEGAGHESFGQRFSRRKLSSEEGQRFLFGSIGILTLVALGEGADDCCGSWM